MRATIPLCLAIISFALSDDVQGATSDWLLAPKPAFPTPALKKGSEGSVKLRIVLAQDGSVAAATVSKSSRDPVLDETARKAVLKWKMRPAVIKPSDLTKGREEIIEFRQEALVAATYPGWKAAFSNEKT